MKQTFIILQIIVVSIFFCSCSKNDTTNTITQPLVNNKSEVTGMTLNTETLVLKKTKFANLSASIIPSNAANKKVNWSSNNLSVATVDSLGRVLAVGSGEAIVTGRSNDNNTVAATCRITVLNTYDLYIAGNGGAFNPGFNALDFNGSFWKNTILNSLTGGYDGARSAKAILVQGNDTYVVGVATNSNGWRYPYLWTNSIALPLSAPQDELHKYALSVAVSGNNVYVAGHTFISPSSGNYGFFQANLWKVTNGAVSAMPLPLPAGLIQSDAFSVTTKGTDVYTAGSVSSSLTSTAVYWKNGDSPVLLSALSGNSYAKAKAITSNGTDIFIAGYDGCGDYGCTRYFKLWKNNMSNELLFETNITTVNNAAEITGITVSGNDVYVSGTTSTGNGNSVANVWRISGNSVKKIVLSDGTKFANATSVMAINDDIFVVGYEEFANGSNTVMPKSKYWRLLKDTVVEVNELSAPEYTFPTSWYGSRAYGVFIK